MFLPEIAGNATILARLVFIFVGFVFCSAGAAPNPERIPDATERIPSIMVFTDGTAAVEGQVAGKSFWTPTVLIAAFGTIIALLQLFHTWLTHRTAENEARRKRTIEMLSQFHERETGKCLIKTMHFVMSKESTQEKVQRMRTSDELFWCIASTFNRLEQVGAMYRHGLLDRGIVAETIGSRCVVICDQSKDFRRLLQDQLGEGNLPELEHMVESFRQNVDE